MNKKMQSLFINSGFCIWLAPQMKKKIIAPAHLHLLQQTCSQTHKKYNFSHFLAFFLFSLFCICVYIYRVSAV